MHDSIDDNEVWTYKETSEMEVDDMVSNLGRKIEEGFKKSKQEGIEKGIEKIAIKMIKKGIDIEEILELTELSRGEILRLKNQIESDKN
ncbi:hypothetical protein [Clostridium sp. DJ247]|uniref:hypothetical protein n=1 Tax=Clostridium sp. DJ247 TaxID=2726188 RepID=UPI0016262135|nr:hypothetical protein [Clostridium sp. DJ247]MBC2582873.1 hypothetical protein [Clostridium sp. DJ247]